METGEYPVEERLPTESEWRRIGASRSTVREALRRCRGVDRGTVQRRQGAGSVVVAASPEARDVHSLSSLADLSQFARIRITNAVEPEITLPAHVAGSDGGEENSRWWLIKGLRRSEAGGKRSYRATYSSYTPQPPSRYVPNPPRWSRPLTTLAARAGEDIIEIEQDLRGETMSKDIAAHLQQKTGTISIRVVAPLSAREGVGSRASDDARGPVERPHIERSSTMADVADVREEITRPKSVRGRGIFGSKTPATSFAYRHMSERMGAGCQVRAAEKCPSI